MSTIAIAAGDDRKGFYAGITALIALCQYVFGADVNATNVTLSSIGENLSISPALLSWVMSSLLLTYAGFLILGGKIGDLYGRRPVCIAGLCCFGAGSFMAFLAPSFVFLLIARTVEGLGCALMIPTTFSMINVVLPEGRLRHRAFAVYAAFQGIAQLVGLGLGGILTTHFGWRYAFLINLPLVIIGLFLAWRFIPASDENQSKAKLDALGAVLVTAAIAFTLYGLTEIGHKGVLSHETLIGLGGALILFVAFIYLEKRVSDPLLPLSILSYPNLAGGDLSCIAAMGSIGALIVLLNLFMQRVMHFSAMMSGLGMIPFALAMTLSGHLLTATMARFPWRPTIFVGFVAQGLAGVVLALVVHFPSYAASLVPAMIAMGIGSILSVITLMALSTSEVPPDHQGIATGVLITCQQAGLALGISVALTVLNAGLSEGISLPSAFARAYIAAALMSALGLVLAVLMTRRPQGVLKPVIH